jgi:hypothetical protein
MPTAKKSQVGQAIDEILARLEPLRAAGIICRAQANTPGASGNTLLNGQIVVVWGGDSQFSAAKAFDSQQTYTSQFVLLGRLLNLKSLSGIEAIRDALYTLLPGMRLTGYSSSLSVQSFTVGQRMNDHQPFEMSVSATGLLVYCADEDYGLDDAVADEAMGAVLAELDFAFSVESQEFTIGIDG